MLPRWCLIPPAGGLYPRTTMNQHDLEQLRRAGQRLGLQREGLEAWIATQMPVAGPEPTTEPEAAIASVEDPVKPAKKAKKKTTKKTPSKFS